MWLQTYETPRHCNGKKKRAKSLHLIRILYTFCFWYWLMWHFPLGFLALEETGVIVDIIQQLLGDGHDTNVNIQDRETKFGSVADACTIIWAQISVAIPQIG